VRCAAGLFCGDGNNRRGMGRLRIGGRWGYGQAPGRGSGGGVI